MPNASHSLHKRFIFHGRFEESSFVHVFLVLLIMSNIPQTSSAWSIEWINLDKSIVADNHNKVTPPRSGHVAFGLDDRVYVFGGYAEESGEVRYPTNDLWVYDPKTRGGWKLVHGTADASYIPQQRLAAAAVTCRLPSGNDGDGNKEAALLLGGWDSQEAGTGGVILQDLQVFSGDDDGDDNSWQQLSFDLQQPTSRLCAVTLPTKTQVLVHNHRCTDHVSIVDLASSSSSRLIRQPTTGTAPSPRGLHACVLLPDTSKMLLFGGAAQDGNMSNEVFVLDTDAWTWQAVETTQGDEARPSPRASPCLVAVDESTCVLFGGASRTEQGGLHGCNDTWLLQLLGNNRCRWTRLSDDGSATAPPGRNAATLTPLACRPAVLNGISDGSSVQYFLLHGGWYPFRTTYNDNFVLKVTK